MNGKIKRNRKKVMITKVRYVKVFKAENERNSNKRRAWSSVACNAELLSPIRWPQRSHSRSGVAGTANL
jgi:hypothetical protein